MVKQGQCTPVWDKRGGCILVQQPGFLGAGHGSSQLGGLRCQSCALKHTPGKVPLLRAPVGYGIAVNCAFQIGMDPVQYEGQT